MSYPHSTMQITIAFYYHLFQEIANCVCLTRLCQRGTLYIKLATSHHKNK